MRIVLTFETEQAETPENFAYAVRRVMPKVLSEAQEQGLLLSGDSFATEQLLEDDKRWNGNSAEMSAHWAVVED